AAVGGPRRGEPGGPLGRPAPPRRARPRPAAPRQRNVHDLTVIARLAPGVDAAAARAAMDALAGQMAEAHPDTNRGIGIRVDPLRGGLSPGDRADAVPLAVLLLRIVSLVLLLPSLNLAPLPLP